jgi:drug/metabolite transporter (DMT)-like permease
MNRVRLIECIAALFGLAGAYLLANKGQHAGWGWVLFLGSNAGWIAFGAMQRHWFLVLQQVGFTYTSVLGIARWLL